MISIFRRLSRSFLGRAVLMIIVVGMAGWGANSSVNIIQQGIGGGFASAAGRSVQPAEIDRRIENYIRQVNQQSPTPVTKQDVLERGEIDQLIKFETSKLSALGYAKKLGLGASDEAVQSRLKAIEAFLNPLTGEIDPVRYAQTLTENGYRKPDFEQEIQDEIVITTLRDAASAAVAPPSVFTSIAAQYYGESREVSWYVLDTAGAPKPVEPAEADIKAFYDSKLDLLKEPERRVLDVLTVSSEDFLHEVAITEQEIATTYEATKSAKFSEPDQRTFIEMLFPTQEAARAAVASLSLGEDADKIAGAIARETRSGPADIVTDNLQREALFGAGKQSGAIFGPRQTPGGWLIARLVSVQPGAVKPLEQVGEEIRLELAKERAKQRVYDKIDAMDDAMAAGLPIEKIAANAGAPVMTLEAVDKSGGTARGYRAPAAAALPEGALDEAFGLAAGEATQVFQREDGAVLVSVRKVLPARTPPFEEVKDSVRAALVFERKTKAANDYAKGFVERITSGELTIPAAAKLAKSKEMSVAQRVTRNPSQDIGPAAASIDKIFGSKAGDVFSLASQSGDRFMIVQLNAVHKPGDAELAALSLAASSAVAPKLGEDVQAAFDAELGKATKVRVHQGMIDSYKASISTQQ